MANEKAQKIIFNYQNQKGLDSAEAVYTDPSVVSDADIKKLQDNGAEVNLYISIGEYEEGYRPEHKPFKGDDVVLAENPQWPDNFKVKFWDEDWQKMTIEAAVDAAERGANGLYLDIVDGYQDLGVQQAYAKEKGLEEPIGDWEADQSIRVAVGKEMKEFVKEISKAVKEVNPDIKVIPQNAYHLFAIGENYDMPDQEYLDAIDGSGLESLFYHAKDYNPSTREDQENQWVQYQKPFVDLALDAGKQVTNINYSFTKEAGDAAVEKSLDSGIIPYRANSDRALKGNDPVEENQNIKKMWDAREQTGSLDLRLEGVRAVEETAALDLNSLPDMREKVTQIG